MSALLAVFITQLSKQGVDASSYRSSKLKQRLRRSFGNSLLFRQPSAQNRAELVFNASIEKGEIIEIVYSASVPGPDEITFESAEPLKNDQSAYQVYHTCKVIRSLLLDVKHGMATNPS